MSAQAEMTTALDNIPSNTSICTWDATGFDIYDPSTWVFTVDVIAKSLSNLCRFGGHVNFYSVAEHSVRVSDNLHKHGAGTRLRLMGLLHDATETYIGDICRPLKKSLYLEDGESVIDFEDSLNLAIMNAFGLYVDDAFDEDWAAVKKADWDVFVEERAERPSPGGGLSPAQAEDMFNRTFQALWRNLQMKVG